MKAEFRMEGRPPHHRLTLHHPQVPLLARATPEVHTLALPGLLRGATCAPYSPSSGKPPFGTQLTLLFLVTLLPTPLSSSNLTPLTCGHMSPRPLCQGLAFDCLS